MHTHPPCSYLVPLILRVTVYRDRFVPGPFYLGAASLAVNLIAIAWVCCAIVLFVLPQVRAGKRGLCRMCGEGSKSDKGV